ncbi:MAG TPA: GxxExxY protein [Terriglobales bacterium]|jgi:hypothetical protein
MDLLVEDLVVVELKCVEKVHPVHEAQLLSYMRLSGKHVGLLINFHVAHLRDGIKRMVDGKGWENRYLPKTRSCLIFLEIPLCTSVPSVVKGF